jgi:hypothetical protein
MNIDLVQRSLKTNINLCDLAGSEKLRDPYDL